MKFIKMKKKLYNDLLKKIKRFIKPGYKLFFSLFLAFQAVKIDTMSTLKNDLSLNLFLFLPSLSLTLSLTNSLATIVLRQISY